MSLRIGTALREGARRTVTRDGLVLAVAFVVIGIVTALATQTIVAEAVDALIEALRTESGTAPEDLTPGEIDQIETALEGQAPLALPISPLVAGLLLVLTGILAEAVNIVAVRAFFADSGQELSAGLAGRNIVLATLNGIVGGIVVGIIVAIGLIFLIVPGIFFAIAFLFLRQEIAVEDENFVDAMASSWQLTKGDRLELFALVLGVAVLVFLVSTVVPLLFGAVSPLVNVIVSILVGGVTAVFGTAVITRAYAQLHADRAAVRNDEADTDEWAV
ncbi:hypothetical protein [Halococcus saccharolyticus]|uniref:DUF7847 domain-containing protein n=1 Tax=Halococcus saccharolyticus DSM 5350 TaxID=1227455 RepID=M0ME45_9EURY|nr:hypothetical protein [Halococcus saccharolyticus]EMA44022.1 hypothetical protein C449_10868 [Halococcus saccharolyticus DSM 5350]